ncbi:MAG: hypothetical protein JNK77_05125 [Saprospiraceae bacterium]|nr:hypothetical protein [Saprospiraceae bacterium]
MLRKALHISLALLIWLNANGIVVNKHYCRNELQSVALFVAARNCHATAAEKSAPKKCKLHCKAGDAPAAAFKKGNCCSDQSTYLKQHTDQVSLKEGKATAKPKILLATIPLIAFNAEPFELPSIKSAACYRPPPLIRDIPVLIQTFRC